MKRPRQIESEAIRIDAIGGKVKPANSGRDIRADNLTYVEPLDAFLTDEDGNEV
jgi:hypothetical protein